MRTAAQGTGGGMELTREWTGKHSYSNSCRCLQALTADLQANRIVRDFGLPEATARTVAELAFADGGAI